MVAVSVKSKCPALRTSRVPGLVADLGANTLGGRANTLISSGGRKWAAPQPEAEVELGQHPDQQQV